MSGVGDDGSAIPMPDTQFTVLLDRVDDERRHEMVTRIGINGWPGGTSPRMARTPSRTNARQ